MRHCAECIERDKEIDGLHKDMKHEREIFNRKCQIAEERIFQLEYQNKALLESIIKSLALESNVVMTVTVEKNQEDK